MLLAYDWLVVPWIRTTAVCSELIARSVSRGTDHDEGHRNTSSVSQVLNAAVGEAANATFKLLNLILSMHVILNSIFRFTFTVLFNDIDN